MLKQQQAENVLQSWSETADCQRSGTPCQRRLPATLPPAMSEQLTRKNVRALDKSRPHTWQTGSVGSSRLPIGAPLSIRQPSRCAQGGTAGPCTGGELARKIGGANACVIGHTVRGSKQLAAQRPAAKAEELGASRTARKCTWRRDLVPQPRQAASAPSGLPRLLRPTWARGAGLARSARAAALASAV